MILKFFRRKSEPDVQLEQGLEKTRRGVFLEISRLFERGDLDDDLYEELEMLLIQADVGWDVSQKLVGDLKTRVRQDTITDPLLAREILRGDDLAAGERQPQPPGENPAARRPLRDHGRRRQRRR